MFVTVQQSPPGIFFNKNLGSVKCGTPCQSILSFKNCRKFKKVNFRATAVEEAKTDNLPTNVGKPSKNASLNKKLDTQQETDFVEVEMELGDMAMRVCRQTQSPVPPPPILRNAADDKSLVSPTSNGNASSKSPSSKDLEEKYVLVQAQKVGIFRRGKYVKGKKVGAGNLAEEGNKVKKGQQVAFIEQLGTFVPIEAPCAGEIVAFTVDEGMPVEYNQLVMEIAPFFGGHIIGDKKYA